jgi:CRP-like cAMP-binding protein
VFFIQKGRVKLCYDITKGFAAPIIVPFNMYVEGSYFGEMEMMLIHYRNLGRDGTAIVDSQCHLLVIGSKELREVLVHFHDVHHQMKLQAKKRREHHERAIEEAKRMAIEKNYKGLKAQLFGG